MGGMDWPGLGELRARRRAALGLVLDVSVVLLVFMALEGIRAGVGRTLTAWDMGTISSVSLTAPPPAG